MSKKIFKLVGLALFLLGCKKAIVSTQKNESGFFTQNSTVTSNIVDIYFSDALNGIACTDNEVLLQTNNGGATWIQNTNHAFGLINSVYILSKTQLFTGGNRINHSFDSGQSFEQLGPFQFGIDGIHFFNVKNGVVNILNDLFRTSDGGLTWKKVYTNTDGGKQLKFVSEKTGYFFGGSSGGGFSLSELYKTTDGGYTWYSINPNMSEIISLDFLNDSIGYLMNQNQEIFKTQNGGQSWTFISTFINDTVTDFVFTNEFHGFATTLSGKIYETKDKGETWMEKYKSIYSLRRIIKVPQSIYVIGDNGTIIKQS